VNPNLSLDWFTTAELQARSDEALGQYSGFFFGAGDYVHPEAALGPIRLARERGVPLVGT
jgi:hypothetical protein